MKEGALIKKLNKLYPDVKATRLVEWGGKNSEYFNYYEGIWFRGSEDSMAVDGLPLYDCYEEFGFEINPKIEKILNDAGWFAEPYDAGTLFAYPK
tara:strand:- start:278 stop:562 length:285 start_codon:yes stop_codon:yes gene_type:complete